MKKLLFTALLLISATTFISCEKHTDPVYPAFNVMLNSQAISGAVQTVEDDTLKFYVKVENVKDYTISWKENGAVLSTTDTCTYIAAGLGDHNFTVEITGGDGPVAEQFVVTVGSKFKSGVYVLSEGNMTSENGSMFFISDKGRATDSVYFKANNSDFGNASQDLFITGGKMYIISQNGNRLNGDGTLVIADALTLKKLDAFNDEIAKTLSMPTHVAVIGNIAYIRDGKGIYTLNLTTRALTFVNGTNRANKSTMAVIGERVFAIGGSNIFAIKGTTVDTIKMNAPISGIAKSSDKNLWVSCTSRPAKISKINAATLAVISTNELGDKQISGGWGSSGAISAKGDTVYFCNASTKVYRHIFGKNSTEMVADVTTFVADAAMVYGNVGVHPVTGDVYVPTIKGYGDFKVNDVVVLDFNGAAPKLKTSYKNYTRFPSGIFFTANF